MKTISMTEAQGNWPTILEPNGIRYKSLGWQKGEKNYEVRVRLIFSFSRSVRVIP